MDKDLVKLGKYLENKLGEKIDNVIGRLELMEGRISEISVMLSDLDTDEESMEDLNEEEDLDEEVDELDELSEELELEPDEPPMPPSKVKENLTAADDSEYEGDRTIKSKKSEPDDPELEELKKELDGKDKKKRKK